MKVLTPGHKYELDHFQSDGHETIQFIEKVPEAEGSTTLRTINNGTTNEEVLEMLLDRLRYLQVKFPCRENACAITHLDEASHWLWARTKDRTKRGVEGKQIK